MLCRCGVGERILSSGVAPKSWSWSVLAKPHRKAQAASPGFARRTLLDYLGAGNGVMTCTGAMDGGDTPQ